MIFTKVTSVNEYRIDEALFTPNIWLCAEDFETFFFEVLLEEILHSEKSDGLGMITVKVSYQALSASKFPYLRKNIDSSLFYQIK